MSFLVTDGSRPETMAFLSAFFFFGAWCAGHPREIAGIIGTPWVLAVAGACAVGVGVLNVAGGEVLYQGEFAWGVVGALVVVC